MAAVAGVAVAGLQRKALAVAAAVVLKRRPVAAAAVEQPKTKGMVRSRHRSDQASAAH